MGVKHMRTPSENLSSRRRLLLAAWASLVLGGAGALPAQTLKEWDGDNSNSWGTSQNWSGGVPNALSEIAVFDSGWTLTTRTPDIGATDYAIGGVRILSNVPAANINITGSTGTLTLNTSNWGGANGIDNQSTRSETIGARLAIGNSQAWVNSNASGGNLLITNTVDLGANALVLSSANASSGIALSGAVSGTGGLGLAGAGSVTVSGAAANSYSGGTAVASGTLVLNKTAGVNATGTGAITVGDTIGAAGSAVLRLNQNNQISNAAAVTVNSDGLFDVNGRTETLATIGGAGTIALGTGSLTLAGTASTTFSGSLTGTGSLIKDVTSTGTLTLSSNNLNFGGNLTVNAGTLAFTGTSPIVAGTLTLGAGSTLRLNGSSLTVDTIHITGNSVIDFGAASASILNTATFVIDPGVTLVSIINWVNYTDYFFADNWTGATLGTRGMGPELQVTFAGASNSATAWMTYDRQITPAPEPATYGVIFSALATALVAFRRRFGRRQS